MKKKLLPLTALLLSKKFIIPAAFLIALGITAGVVIKFKLALPQTKVQGETIVKIPISLNLDVDLLKCENDSKSLIVNISKPTFNQDFLTTDTIDFAGSINYTCKDSPTFKYEWFLDGAVTPFSTDKDASQLKLLAAGSHIVKYKVSDDLISSSRDVTFNVDAPVIVACNQSCDNGHICSDGLSCTNGKCLLASNPSSVSCQPNKPPVADITDWYSSNSSDPKNGTDYDADQYCPPSNVASCAPFTYFYLNGTGNDPEDGVLAGSSLSWDYQMNGTGGIVHMGNGNSISRYKLNGPIDCSSGNAEGSYRYNSYAITLTVTDSKGTTSTKTITINVRINCLG